MVNKKNLLTLICTTFNVTGSLVVYDGALNLFNLFLPTLSIMSRIIRIIFMKVLQVRTH